MALAARIRPLGIVAMRLGGAEHGHHRIADVLVDRSPEVGHDAIDHFEIAAKQPVGLFGIKPIGERGEADNIGEQDGDLSALA